MQCTCWFLCCLFLQLSKVYLTNFNLTKKLVCTKLLFTSCSNYSQDVFFTTKYWNNQICFSSQANVQKWFFIHSIIIVYSSWKCSVKMFDVHKSILLEQEHMRKNRKVFLKKSNRWIKWNHLVTKANTILLNLPSLCCCDNSRDPIRENQITNLLSSPQLTPHVVYKWEYR